MTSLRVAIIQDYVPKFRIGFFSALAGTLENADIELKVIAGAPAGAQKLRNDASSHMPWLQFAKSHRFSVGSVENVFYGSSRLWRDCDGIIFGLRGNSLDLNLELTKRVLSHRRVAVWGHIGAYIKDANPFDMAVEKYQMRLCDHVFAYTPAGADFASRVGVQRSKITTVMNSTDVSQMNCNFEALDEEAVRSFQQSNMLTEQKTFGYIGGIDAPKRIDLLAQTLDTLWIRDPSIKLIVGGRGNQESLLTKAIRRGQVIHLGYAEPKEKALIYRLSTAILNPGRIGLLAVECLAMQKPILTTDWGYHGPEYEYLTENEDVFVARGGAEKLAELVLGWTITPAIQGLRTTPYPTLDDMVTNFSSGVLKMLSPP